MKNAELYGKICCRVECRIERMSTSCSMSCRQMRQVCVIIFHLDSTAFFDFFFIIFYFSLRHRRQVNVSGFLSSKQASWAHERESEWNLSNFEDRVERRHIEKKTVNCEISDKEKFSHHRFHDMKSTISPKMKRNQKRLVASCLNSQAKLSRRRKKYSNYSIFHVPFSSFQMSLMKVICNVEEEVMQRLEFLYNNSVIVMIDFQKNFWVYCSAGRVSETNWVSEFYCWIRLCSHFHEILHTCSHCYLTIYRYQPWKCTAVISSSTLILHLHIQLIDILKNE